MSEEIRVVLYTIVCINFHTLIFLFLSKINLLYMCIKNGADFREIEKRAHQQFVDYLAGIPLGAFRHSVARSIIGHSVNGYS